MDTSVTHKDNIPEYSAAHYLLEGLTEIGIDICSAISAPITRRSSRRWRAIASVARPCRRSSAVRTRTPPRTWREATLWSPGVWRGVIVHVDVGTANAANAMHNLFRSRLPVLLMAGKAPYTSHSELVGTRDTHVHWVQEPFDKRAWCGLI